MNKNPSFVVVAVDGPAGSGKSSVSKATARELGFDYLDTGAAYRGFALHCLERGVDTLGPGDVIETLPRFEYSIGIDPDNYFVKVDSEIVTDDIREPRITGVVSNIARVPEVRQYMVDLFRSIIAGSEKPGIVVEGRDITTVVAPDAQARILLTASEEARMGRRAAELSGESSTTTAQQLSYRDAQDSKVVDFMNAADGVITIDSTNLDFDQTVTAVASFVRSSM
ncbi:(d)CMP kinase [Salinibacterium sp. NSLL150]|uniref:(d)CMP kinase n=1 Tax=unclassified Salinibacterium TaxID=2632331 RepID=UPI0018CE0120|nr:MULTISPECIES: (d)CMP kinase [unclassified Salinibacterium]MBH0054441.1 (d)CMP kinase [Salinibacterium sp. SWN139]MBH0083729.1 (d)CMP kinase [Salinibacterium sp. SWN167]MBH0099389.1 (d)CMP kinase [Salinibacterium sp. NSLL35]MBH0102143.1 (d)CMP kinase [Salinibacterium sp. NSLL150]MBH0104903.1 (d)CMP kinase [Salinibacterium sp. NSLL16]